MDSIQSITNNPKYIAIIVLAQSEFACKYCLIAVLAIAFDRHHRGGCFVGRGGGGGRIVCSISSISYLKAKGDYLTNKAYTHNI